MHSLTHGVTDMSGSLDLQLLLTSSFGFSIRMLVIFTDKEINFNSLMQVSHLGASPSPRSGNLTRRFAPDWVMT